MPDQKRLAYPENSESYKLFAPSLEKVASVEEDAILLQSNVVSNANGSAYVEYNDCKGE